MDQQVHFSGLPSTKQDITGQWIANHTGFSGSLQIFAGDQLALVVGPSARTLGTTGSCLSGGTITARGKLGAPMTLHCGFAKPAGCGKSPTLAKLINHPLSLAH